MFGATSSNDASLEEGLTLSVIRSRVQRWALVAPFFLMTYDPSRPFIASVSVGLGAQDERSSISE